MAFRGISSASTTTTTTRHVEKGGGVPTATVRSPAVLLERASTPGLLGASTRPHSSAGVRQVSKAKQQHNAVFRVEEVSSSIVGGGAGGSGGSGGTNVALSVASRKNNSWFVSRRRPIAETRLGRPLWRDVRTPEDVRQHASHISVSRVENIPPGAPRLAFGHRVSYPTPASLSPLTSVPGAPAARDSSDDEADAADDSAVEADLVRALPASGYVARIRTGVSRRGGGAPKLRSAAADSDEGETADDDGLAAHGSFSGKRTASAGIGAAQSAHVHTYKTARFSAESLCVWNIVCEPSLEITDRIRAEMAKMHEGSGLLVPVAGSHGGGGSAVGSSSASSAAARRSGSGMITRGGSPPAAAGAVRR